MISPEHPQQADSGAHSVEAYEDKPTAKKLSPEYSKSFENAQ